MDQRRKLQIGVMREKLLRHSIFVHHWLHGPGMPPILLSVASRVILFSTDSCTFCVHAKSLLSKRGVAFEEVNLSAHPELQTELASVTGLTSFPQIIVDGQTLGGLNELRGADKSGAMASWSAA